MGGVNQAAGMPRSDLSLGARFKRFVGVWLCVHGFALSCRPAPDTLRLRCWGAMAILRESFDLVIDGSDFYRSIEYAPIANSGTGGATLRSWHPNKRGRSQATLHWALSCTSIHVRTAP